MFTLAELLSLHAQALALAATDPESADAARHLAYAIELRLLVGND